MSQIKNPGKFNYWSKVFYNISNTNNSYGSLTGHVAGKVANSELYLVVFDKGFKSHNFLYANLLVSFGSPNRHLELEWGKFSGYWNEFILPGDSLKEIT